MTFGRTKRLPTICNIFPQGEKSKFKKVRFYLEEISIKITFHVFCISDENPKDVRFNQKSYLQTKKMFGSLFFGIGKRKEGGNKTN